MCMEAYAAGLLDGEGCVFINTSTETCQLQVTFTMTDTGPLQHLSERWGGKVREVKRRTVTGRTSYNWVASDSRALRFLKDVRPWVSCKLEQVEVALEYPFWKMGGEREQALITRRELADQLKELKKP